MKSKLFIFTVSIVWMALFVVGCSNLYEQPNETQEVQLNASMNSPPLTKSESIALIVQQKGTYRISKTEALEKLDRFSTSNSKMASISVQSATLKTNPFTGKEMYYEVVFDSEKGRGFSILSADERVEEVLCYSEVGSIADTSFNKNLKFCLELLDQYVEAMTKEELDVDVLALSAKEKLKVNMPVTKSDPFTNPSGWTYIGTYSYHQKNERLRYVKNGGWHQDWPYNELLEFINPPTNTVRAYIGCGMVAVAQIMSYHGKAYSNYISTGDWTSIRANPTTSVKLKNLMKDLNETMRTGPPTTDGTPCSIVTARSFLNNNGYTASAAVDYSFAAAWSALFYGPTYIRGDNTISSSGKAGHAWVIDGIYEERYPMYDLYISNDSNDMDDPYYYHYLPFPPWQRYVRYDWGWGPRTDNTWFSDGVFTLSIYNFNANVKIISAIY